MSGYSEISPMSCLLDGDAYARCQILHCYILSGPTLDVAVQDLTQWASSRLCAVRWCCIECGGCVDWRIKKTIHNLLKVSIIQK